ncbi:hypothetical protein ACQPU1_05100 [Clostridium paraputrificum]|uniref:hypothetical protein n=1 Tax=Clostridium TaxID=1485 RepID=UPI003D330D22
MNLGEKYIKILEVICEYYGLDEENFIQLLKDRDNKYLLLLLLKKYRCMDEKKVGDILNLKSKRSITYNVRKAEEKLLISKDFRDRFFEIEEGLLK